MKSFLAFWASVIVLMSAILFWRNKGKYRGHSGKWLILKTLSELALLISTAVRLPVLLVAWISMWITRPIQAPWLKTTVGIVLAVGLSCLMAVAMEVVLLLSVFAIDDITGEDRGVLFNWNEAKRAEALRQAQPA